MLKIFHFCKKYLSENVLFLYLYVVLCIFSSLFSLLLPITTGNFIDMLILHDSFYDIFCSSRYL
jgi:ATP-binding cassette subfamily C protein